MAGSLSTSNSSTLTRDEFFAGYDASRPLFEAMQHLIASIGPADLHVTKSQIAFRRRKPIAWVWVPERCLRCRAAPGRFTHHLEIHTLEELDEEVRGWLRTAWFNAG